MLWNPNQYLKFADARLRPAMDLVNRAAVYFAVNGNGQGPSSDHHQVKRVLDLGE
jgi:trans-aconitate methyltransferase